jgi:hypothetical protein
MFDRCNLENAYPVFQNNSIQMHMNLFLGTRRRPQFPTTQRLPTKQESLKFTLHSANTNNFSMCFNQVSENIVQDCGFSYLKCYLEANVEQFFRCPKLDVIKAQIT